MQIDVHWHHIPASFVEDVLSGRHAIDGVVERRGDQIDLKMNMGFTFDLTPDLYETELVEDALDAAGHDHVLAALPPPLMHYEVDPDGGLLVSRLINEAWAATAAGVPGGRLLPLTQVPLQDPLASADEVRRASSEYGFKGVAIRSNVIGQNLGDDALLPFWEAVWETESFVFVHPQTPLGAERLKKHQLVNFVGLPIDTAAAVASLIFDGVYDRFPGLKTCFAHAGGAFPYLLGRWDHGFMARNSSGFLIDREPSSYLDSIYCDSLTHSQNGLRFLTDEIGSDRVLLGSDYPFDMGEPDPAGALRAAIETPEVVDAIRGDTAARLVGLD